MEVNDLVSARSGDPSELGGGVWTTSMEKHIGKTEAEDCTKTGKGGTF